MVPNLIKSDLKSITFNFSTFLDAQNRILDIRTKLQSFQQIFLSCFKNSKHLHKMKFDHCRKNIFKQKFTFFLPLLQINLGATSSECETSLMSNEKFKCPTAVSLIKSTFFDDLQQKMPKILQKMPFIETICRFRIW